MSVFSRKRRWTQSQRVVLSAFLFGGVLCVLIVGMFWSARNPDYYSYHPTNDDLVTQDMVNRVLNG
jgi:hypothetical protein